MLSVRCYSSVLKMLKFYVFVLVLFCLNRHVCGEDSTTGFRINLTRQKTAYQQMLNAPNLEKYGINLNWLHKKSQMIRTNDSIAFYRYLDKEYYGKIVIGHPGQTLNVAFDTAWTTTWVLSQECQFWFHAGCFFHNKYDHSKSSSYKPDGKKIIIPEGNFNLTGYYSYDNISFAHSNVKNFSFVEINAVPFSFLFNKIDGILGLGLKFNDYEPFFYNLMKTSNITDPLFCIFLNRDKQSKHGGNVILGAMEWRHVHSKKGPNNETIYDDILYLPIKGGTGYWEFDLDSVSLYGKETPLTFCQGKSCKAIPDTSSNNIEGPREDIAKIHSTINAQPFYLGRYTVNCDTVMKLPPLDFVIGGKNFTLKPRDYTIKFTYFHVTMCLSAFVPHDIPNFWVLGGAFLSEYYTIYDIKNKQIGIVKSA